MKQPSTSHFPNPLLPPEQSGGRKRKSEESSRKSTESNRIDRMENDVFDHFQQKGERSQRSRETFSSCVSLDLASTVYFDLGRVRINIYMYFRPRKLRCISFRLFRSVVVQAPSLCHPFFSCRGKRSTRSKKGKGKWREASLFCVSTIVCACILTGFGGVARPGVGQAERYPSPREWPGVWDHLFDGQGSWNGL